MPHAIHLSPWTSWDTREQLPSLPGVYVIAKANPSEIIYFGLTCAKGGLKKRVALFHQVAVKGQGNHAGGITYNSLYGPELSDLIVAVHTPFAINPSEDVLHPYIKYAERRLIWEFVEQHGRLPACNSE